MQKIGKERESWKWISVLSEAFEKVSKENKFVSITSRSSMDWQRLLNSELFLAINFCLKPLSDNDLMRSIVCLSPPLNPFAKLTWQINDEWSFIKICQLIDCSTIMTWGFFANDFKKDLRVAVIIIVFFHWTMKRKLLGCDFYMFFFI